MRNLLAQDFSHGTRIGWVPIRCHAFWRLSRHHRCLMEATLRCIHSSWFAQQRVDPIAGSRDGSIPRAPPAVYL
jgi:hypothetical protein